MLFYYISEKFKASNGLIVKALAWSLFLITVVASIILLLDNAMVDTLRDGQLAKELNVQLIVIVTVSLLSTAFLLALSYLLSNVQEQMKLMRCALRRIES